jgi:predicted dehydrogenase
VAHRYISQSSRPKSFDLNDGGATPGGEVIMKILRVGVVGAGIGAAYVAGFQRQPGVEVTSVCARSTRRLDPLVEKYRIPHAYTNFEEMLARDALDIVVIATPNYLHYPMVMASLEAGLHVLCDKPMALDTNQAREMASRADELRLKHGVAFTWRYLPAAAYMKEIIASGFLGKPYHLNVQYFVRTWADSALPIRWQLDKAQSGSGALGNLGSHVIHLVHWWLGSFRRVCAMMTTVVPERAAETAGTRVPIEVDDTCSFLGELENGTAAVFSASSVAWVQHVFLRISLFGSEGSLIFEDDWGEKDAMNGRILAMRKNEVAPALVAIPARLTGEFLDMPDYYTPLRACFSRMADEFVTAIREDRPASPNFHDGVLVQEVIGAVLQSQAVTGWVTIPSTRTDA